MDQLYREIIELQTELIEIMEPNLLPTFDQNEIDEIDRLERLIKHTKNKLDD